MKDLECCIGVKSLAGRGDIFDILVEKKSPWEKCLIYFFNTSGSVVLLLLLFNTNSVFIFPHTWNKQIRQDEK